MRSAETQCAAGFTLIEVLVALAIVGLAMTAIANVFGNGAVGQETASDTQTALALGEERLTLASAAAVLRPGTDKGTFDGRFTWRTTVTRYVDDGDPKQATQPAPTLSLYRVAVDIVWRDGHRSREFALWTLRLGTAVP